MLLSCCQLCMFWSSQSHIQLVLQSKDVLQIAHIQIYCVGVCHSDLQEISTLQVLAQSRQW